MVVEIDAANKYRMKIGQLLAAHEELLAIDVEYNAANIAGGVADADFPDITKQQFTDGVSSAQAVMATINTHKTNLYIASDGSQR